MWRRYYHKWRQVTQEFIDPGLLELVDPLRAFAPPAVVVDKTRYSAFVQSSLQSTLVQRSLDTLIISGAETDVCVLATVLDAVDVGYRVIVASDAVCSSSDECHDALMTLYHQRFSEQIEIAETEAILESGNSLPEDIAYSQAHETYDSARPVNATLGCPGFVGT